MKEEYNIKDYLNPELSKEIIEELVKENAELKAENKIVRQAAKDFCEINEAYMKYEDCLKDIKAIAEDKIDCKQYEIDHDCFNDTRCKALKELIETLQEILALITKAEVGE